MHKMQRNMVSPSECLDAFQYGLKVQGRKVSGFHLYVQVRQVYLLGTVPMAHNTSRALQKYFDFFLSQKKNN